MKLAVIGFGGVAKAFLQLIHTKKTALSNMGLTLDVLYIFNSKGCLYMPDGIPAEDLLMHVRSGGNLEDYPLNLIYNITFDDMILNGDVDAVIELTSSNKETGEPGNTYIRRALENGLHVITGNKGPISLYYDTLKSIAKKSGVQLGIGCTVGGALPSMNAGLIDMAGSDLHKIEGVLNGTTNQIIKLMEEHGTSYQDALTMAKKAGIAEADPGLDVEGWDTAVKLLILTNVLCGQNQRLHDVMVEGITGLTHEDIRVAKLENKKYKLIGRAEKTAHDFILHVKLEKIGSDHPFYNVDGKNKAVRFTSDTLGDLTVTGGASGVTPAAASILRDIINIHKGYRFV